MSPPGLTESEPIRSRFLTTFLPTLLPACSPPVDISHPSLYDDFPFLTL
jgi:hypothetical protein